jgi:hypothetical protein
MNWNWLGFLITLLTFDIPIFGYTPSAYPLHLQGTA